MKKLTFFVLFSSLCLFVTAQDRATMGNPVIKFLPEGIVEFKADFSDLVATGKYRVGFGSEADRLTGAKLELLKDGKALTNALIRFDQKHTSNWWNVPQVLSQGFVASGADLPAKGAKLTFKVNVAKTDLDKVKKVFLFIAREYGPETWYLEDGTDLGDTNW
jgi:hypothetical protein